MNTQLPLRGAKVLLLRENPRDIARRLKALGAAVVQAPIVSARAIGGAFEKFVRRGIKPDWAVFTSVSAIRAFASAPPGARRLVKNSRLACVGPRTAQEAAKMLSRAAFFIPKNFTTKSLALNLTLRRGESVLLVRSANADVEMDRILDRRGAKVTRVSPYRLVYKPLPSNAFGQLKKGKITHVFFGARSQVLALETACRRRVPGLPFKKVLGGATAVAIGPPTAKALLERGIKGPRVRIHTYDGMIKLLVRKWPGTSNS